MSFLTMHDRDYVDGLIGIYELNNVALLREACLDAYIASAEHYRVLRAELETPDKAALVHREFVREAVRRSVLDRKAFDPALVSAMAAEAGIPEEDRTQVVTYIGQEFGGLHEGNLVRCRLRLAELEAISQPQARSRLSMLKGGAVPALVGRQARSVGLRGS